MDNINIRTEAFKNALYDLINKSQLPAANVYYVFSLVEKEVAETYKEVLENDRASMQEQEQTSEQEQAETKEEE